jgi:hypothetical protein
MPVVLIGYDSGWLDMSRFQSQLTTTYTPWSPYYSTEWLVNFTIIEANETWESRLTSAVSNATTWTTGMRLNESRIAAINGNPATSQWPYVNTSGSQVDSRRVLAWLAANPEPSLPNNSGQYPLYIFNLTALDNSANASDHWWYHQVWAKDANREWNLPSWRQFILNDTTIVRPMAGYHGPDSPITIIDPTAESWINRWWDAMFSAWQSGSQPDYLDGDLDHFVADRGSLSNADKEDVSDYISTWINDFVYMLHTDYIWFPTDARMVQVEVRMFTDFTTGPHACGNISWMVNTTAVQSAVQSLMPWRQVNVLFSCDYIGNVSAMQNAVDSRTSIDNGSRFRNGWGLVDSSSLHNYISNNKNTFYQQVGPLDAQVVAACFVFDNRSFVVGPSMITGLGGGGVAIQAFFADRAYDEQGNPREGFTFVVVHEVGHAIGLAHTFTHGDPPRYAGEFSDDAMGYQNDNAHFSVARRDSYQRALLDLHEEGLRDGYVSQRDLIDGRIDTPTIGPLLRRIEARYETYSAALEENRFWSAWNESVALPTMNSILESYVRDTIPPSAAVLTEVENEIRWVRLDAQLGGTGTDIDIMQAWFDFNGSYANVTSLLNQTDTDRWELNLTQNEVDPADAPLRVLFRVVDQAGLLTWLNVSNPDLANLTEHNWPPSPVVDIKPETTRERRPLIEWSPSVDPDGDVVSYLMRIGTTTSAADLMNWTNLGPVSNWTPDFDLPTQEVYVQMQASDGRRVSDIHEAIMRILPNGVPIPPTLIHPAWTNLSRPNLTWSPCIDIDHDPLSYHLRITDSENETVLNWTTLTNTSFPLPLDLAQGIYTVELYCSDAWDDSLLTRQLMQVDLPDAPPAANISAPEHILPSPFRFNWTQQADSDGDEVRWKVRLIAPDGKHFAELEEWLQFPDFDFNSKVKWVGNLSSMAPWDNESLVDERVTLYPSSPGNWSLQVISNDGILSTVASHTLQVHPTIRVRIIEPAVEAGEKLRLESGRHPVIMVFENQTKLPGWGIRDLVVQCLWATNWVGQPDIGGMHLVYDPYIERLETELDFAPTGECILVVIVFYSMPWNGSAGEAISSARIPLVIVQPPPDVLQNETGELGGNESVDKEDDAGSTSPSDAGFTSTQEDILAYVKAHTMQIALGLTLAILVLLLLLGRRRGPNTSGPRGHPGSPYRWD